VLLTLLAAAIVGGPGHTGHTEGLPAKAPKSVGMSAERLATIDRVIQRGITAGGFPGASVIVGRKGATVVAKGFGHLGWGSESPFVLADRTIYDLASLTKVIGTTTAAMVLFDEGKLALDEKVTHYVPGFSGGLKDEVTVRQLLMHRGGLPAGRDLWRHAHTPEEARQLVLDVPLEYKPGTGFIYSDLGADILGMVVEAAAGETLDVFLQSHVFGPLGMTDTGFRPADSLVYRIAPTEVSPPRGYPLRGEVHDENAFALGGVAGHAGLFGTAADLAVFAQMMLNGGIYDGNRIIADSTIKLFTARAAGSRALGWEVGERQHGAGAYLGENTYGHTGFTGTSMWIDPEREMFVILLTNRVHAARARRPAKVIADVRADLADASALAVTDENLAVAEMPSSFRADRAVGWNRPVRREKPRRSKSAKKSASTSLRSEKSAKVRSPAGKSAIASAAPKSSKIASAKGSSAKKGSITKKGTLAMARKKPAAKKIDG
jgi:CubicO group peptidase (beta-lactamase class C family)